MAGHLLKAESNGPEQAPARRGAASFPRPRDVVSISWDCVAASFMWDLRKTSPAGWPSTGRERPVGPRRCLGRSSLSTPSLIRIVHLQSGANASSRAGLVPKSSPSSKATRRN